MEVSIENKDGRTLREILSSATRKNIFSNSTDKKLMFFNCHRQKYVARSDADKMRVWGHTEYEDKIVFDMVDHPEED